MTWSSWLPSTLAPVACVCVCVCVCVCALLENVVEQGGGGSRGQQWGLSEWGKKGAWGCRERRSHPGGLCAMVGRLLHASISAAAVASAEGLLAQWFPPPSSC